MSDSLCNLCDEIILKSVLQGNLLQSAKKSLSHCINGDLVYACLNGHISGFVTCNHSQKLKLRTASPKAKKYPNEKYYSCHINFGQPDCCKVRVGNGKKFLILFKNFLGFKDN